MVPIIRGLFIGDPQGIPFSSVRTLWIIGSGPDQIVERAVMAKQERKIAKKVEVDALEQINRNAAGIDIGAEQVYVAVPPGRDEESVRTFPTFTADL